MRRTNSGTPRVHFIGVGGVGMNGLAQLAARSGWTVGGSDRGRDPASKTYQALERAGVVLWPQNGSGVNAEVDHVVFSTAIEEDNPDLVKARELGIPPLHRAEFLKKLIGEDELVAVAGTAGKTTTTALLGWIFERLGRDPSVYNGAAALNWKTDETLGNVRVGAANLWIIEADESDKSFLTFQPSHSIITNISKDHYELDELHAMFDQFERQTRGVTVRGDALRPEALDVPLLGAHNVENARCALALCVALGMDRAAVLEAIAEFQGVERRLEVAGTTHGVTVIDDYAHNPAKIAAALRAVAERHGTVHAYWRPHGFGPLRQGLEGFVETFARHWKARGGTLHILPVYYAGGTTTRDIRSDDLVKRLNSAGVPARLVSDYAALKQALERSARAGDATLGMGARDPELPRFAQQLVSEWKTPPA